MKITSLLALSALMTIGANAQTVLYSQNFESVTFVDGAAAASSIGLFNATTAPITSAGETAYNTPQTAALGLAGHTNGSISVKGTGNTTWNNATGVPTRSNILALNGTGLLNFLNLSLAAGDTMTVTFDYWGVFGANPNMVNFAGNQVGSDFSHNNSAKFTFTGTFTNNTGSTITGAFQIDNGGNLGVDNILVTSIPEPSAALLGGLGALALLRRRRA
jgi:hypothetical protein